MGRRKPSATQKSRKQKTANQSVAKKETAVPMDETIWKELPEELLETVISKLPIATILRFRSVCRKWNSSPFLQCWVPPELPLIYALVAPESDNRGEAVGALYDPWVRKWYFSTHIPQLRWHRLEPAPGRGLICYPEHYASIRVGNLLTRNWKVYQWTRMLTYSSYTIAFVDNPLGCGGYKIVWVKPRGKYGVHDYSAEKSATTVGRIPDSFVRHKSLLGRGLVIGSVVYFRGINPDGILSYDIVRGSWEQLLVPDPPNSHYISLADGVGRLWLLGWVGNNKYAAGFQPCVCVWELDTRIRSWIEVARMPSWYCSKFRSIFVDVKCLSNRRLLVISLTGRLLKQHTTGVLRFNKVFAYDVVRRKWSMLPECIPPGCKKPHWVWYGFGFFPCLSASP